MKIIFPPFIFETSRFALRGKLIANHEDHSPLTVGLGDGDGIQ
jgi:hypothetical protein